MAEYVEDVIAYPTMIKLLGCVESELAAAGLSAPSFVGPMAGLQTLHEYCGSSDEGDQCNGGQLTARLVREFPFSSFPDQDTGAWRPGVQLGFEVELELVRCSPVGDDRGNPPSRDEWLAAVRDQLADKAAMRRAICKCMSEAGVDFALGQYTPVGPQGGCLGGNWTVIVGK